MRLKGLLLVSFLLTIAVAPAFAQYEGGDNDGSAVAASCVTTLDGVGQFSFGTLTGSSTFCDFATEAYSLDLTNPPQDIQFYWSLPPGATLLQGNTATPNILVQFGNTAGVISVTAVTPCTSQTFNLAVTNGVCTMYNGGDNDGDAVAASCITTLDGVGQFSYGTLTGSSTFCDFSQESFTMSMNNPPQDVQYYWTVPAGATILTGNNTPSVSVLFGNTPGTVSVRVVTPCTDQTFNLPVTNGTCTMYSGGDNDGFSVGPSCVTDTNGVSQFSFGSFTGAPTFCPGSSEVYTIELNNAPADASFYWTVPSDATVISNPNSNSVSVLFGVTAGTVSVTVITPCTTQSFNMGVSPGACSMYAGGDNDGFSMTPLCTTTFDGTQLVNVNPIVGSTNFCQNGNEGYSVKVDFAPSNTSYRWTVPSDATITQGQGTNTILVLFGSSDGTVSVDVITDCGVTTQNLAVTSQNCSFYAGGMNDGFSMTPSCVTDLSGNSVFTVTGINGPSNFCFNSTEAFNLVLANAPSNVRYVWSVPSDATIVSGQGTTSILVTFGVSNGNIGVTIITDCATITPAPVAVSGTSCIFYAGGDNDGFSMTRICVTDLSGTPFTASISGSSTFCTLGTETYTVTALGATAFVWTVPSDASIMSGQGTSQVLVSFGTSSGTVSVTVFDACGGNVTKNLPVTATICTFYRGGNNDGFSVTTIFNVGLPVELVSFDATVRSGIVYLDWQTSSEHNNDFFSVERSRDGKSFENFLKVDGAGTTSKALKYQARDPDPYHGISYYRLSQTDYDGQINYYKVISVKIETFAEITKLYPNPVKRDDEINIDYYAEVDGQVKITIIDPAGRGNDSGMVDVKSGINLFKFTPHFKEPGVHVIIVRSRDKAEALKLVVY